MTNPIPTTTTTFGTITSNSEPSTTTSRSANKRRKTPRGLVGVDDDDRQLQSLLPGLPDHIAQLCLSSVHPSILYSVCRSWRRLLYSHTFPPFLSIYALLLSTNNPSESETIEFSSFDPISSTWHCLPPPPPLRRLLLRHPSFISRYLPIQSVSVSGNLVLLAATADKFLPALSHPLIFNPLTKKWSHGPPLSAPRRWCAAGACGGVVYVASGIGSHYSTEIARSVEKWDLATRSYDNNKIRNRRIRRNYNLEEESSEDWRWEKMGGLRDGKFCREAIDAIGWKGKLCMVNVKGYAAKEGIIYDVERDAWEDMPQGMLFGWRGPAAAMDEETIYVVDESKGALRKYDSERDIWVEIITANEMLKGAQQVAAAGGRVCIVCGGGVNILVADVVAAPPRLWVLEAPSGFEAVAIHILPRMSKIELLQPFNFTV